MSFYVRKIAIAKWRGNSSNIADVKADAITGCIKTSSDKLSIWKVETLEDIDNAALAIISGQQKFDKIDIIILKEDYFKDVIEIDKSDGRTPVDSLVDTHYDLVNLTYSKLGIIKDIYLEALNNDCTKRITKQSSKELIKKAIESGLLDFEKLDDSLKEDFI